MAPQRLACFGDSLFAGYGLAPSQALPVRLEALLRSRGLDARALNLGVSGETSGEGLARLDEVLELRPDAALVEFGANDCHQLIPPRELEDNLTAILQTLVASGIPPLLVGVCGLPWVPAGYGRELAAVFPRLALHLHLPLFPDILAPYAGNPALLLPDDMHPNAAGVEAMALALLPQCVRLLEQAAQVRAPH